MFPNSFWSKKEVEHVGINSSAKSFNLLCIKALFLKVGILFPGQAVLATRATLFLLQ